MVGHGQFGDFVVWLVTPESGGMRSHTAAHLVDYRAENRRRLDPAGH
jgi:hypothetical protein